jgi:hypothetical protein
MTYRIRTAKPADEDSLAAYRQFSDWYARFNTRGGVVPLPFPRLVINEILFRQKAIPTMVELEIPGRGMTLRAEHRTGWLLSKQDRQRIEKVGEQISQFRSVPPEEFFHGAAEGPLQ